MRKLRTMRRMMKKHADVASFIADYPPATRKMLRQLRSLIRKAAPEAEEKISYGMAGYKYHGMFAYFNGYDHHIGFYPGAKAIVKFKNKLKGYKTSKGTVQFPLDAPLPTALIKEMLGWLKRERDAKVSKQ